MARADGKSVLQLSLMAYPTALHPATSYPGKICFSQIIRDLGHRIKYLKVAPETGEEVSDPRHLIGSYYAILDRKVGHGAST